LFSIQSATAVVGTTTNLIIQLNQPGTYQVSLTCSHNGYAGVGSVSASGTNVATTNMIHNSTTNTPAFQMSANGNVSGGSAFMMLTGYFTVSSGTIVAPSNNITFNWSAVNFSNYPTFDIIVTQLNNSLPQATIASIIQNEEKVEIAQLVDSQVDLRMQEFFKKYLANKNLKIDQKDDYEDVPLDTPDLEADNLVVHEFYKPQIVSKRLRGDMTPAVTPGSKNK